MSQDAPDKIEALILQTNDPRDKALLLVLLAMSKSLQENTKLTQDLHNDFQKHAGEEMALIVRGRFLWRVLLWLAFILQGVLGFFFIRHMDTFDKLQSQVQEIAADITVFKIIFKRTGKDGP